MRPYLAWLHAGIVVRTMPLELKYVSAVQENILL